MVVVVVRSHRGILFRGAQGCTYNTNKTRTITNVPTTTTYLAFQLLRGTFPLDGGGVLVGCLRSGRRCARERQRKKRDPRINTRDIERPPLAPRTWSLFSPMRRSLWLPHVVPIYHTGNTGLTLGIADAYYYLALTAWNNNIVLIGVYILRVRTRLATSKRSFGGLWSSPSLRWRNLCLFLLPPLPRRALSFALFCSFVFVVLRRRRARTLKLHSKVLMNEIFIIFYIIRRI